MEASRTASGVALLRAFHQLYDSSPKILDDTIVLRLLSPEALERLRADPAPYQRAGARALRVHVLLRSHYAEDHLQAAVARGVRQYLLLGAGLDTFAYRQPTWASWLRIFEADQPASQSDKQQRLRAAGIEPPANLEFVPINFETTSLADGLGASRFDLTQPAFVSWLGVMVYLSRQAAEAVLAFAAALPRTSEIVFTFSPPDDGPGLSSQSRLDDLVAEAGEPFRTRITQDELVGRLATLGFSSVSVPTGAELNERYLRERPDGLRSGPRQNIVSAVV